MTMNKRRKKKYLTAALIGLLIGVLCVGGFLVYTLHYLSDLTQVMPYDEAGLTYSGTDSIYLETGEGFAADLCVGENSVYRDDVVLTEGSRGVIFDLSGKKVLFSDGMYDKIYPASITKLMTALLALEYGDPDAIVTISWEDLELESGSQVIGLQIGDQVRLKDLITAMLVHSGNDGAQAIARHIGGSQAAFVKMMNDEASKLGATGTHFMNPTGLHDDNHYTTMYDIYLMLNEAIKNDTFINISQLAVYQLNYTTKEGEAKSVTLDSTDRYLTGGTMPPRNVTVLGGKTGTTSMAGHCLALASQNAYGEVFITVVLKAKSTEALYTDMNTLLSAI